jgi:hypothetical protein
MSLVKNQSSVVRLPILNIDFDSYKLHELGQVPEF